MYLLRLLLISLCCLLAVACGDDAPPSPPPQSSPAVDSTPSADKTTGITPGTGSVTVQILPENPTSSGCLRAAIKGVPGRSAVVWKVNGEIVSSGTDTELCNSSYRKDDLVSVEVGTIDKGASASVTIANTPPRVVDISSKPAEIFAGIDVSVTPVAEDVDGDEVSFSYQWLINGEADPLLTEATLPGKRFSRGDTIQVLIVPNDFVEDGPTYESYAQLIPNAPPRISSEPPQSITSLDYRYQVKVSDPDDSQFTYRLDEAPEGMIIDPASGLIQWSLAEVPAGDYTIAVVVTDPEGAESAQEYTLSLSAAN